MSSSESDLSVLQANFLAAVVASPKSTAKEVGATVESLYGIDLPRSRVYNQVSRLTSLGLVTKSDPRGSRGKAITPTSAGRDLAEEHYDWIVERMRTMTSHSTAE